jgi:hypothetical protein
MEPWEWLCETLRTETAYFDLDALPRSLWLQIVTVIAAQNTARIWPAVLVLVTISTYLATACTLASSNYWVVALFWLAVAVTVGGGARQIATHDTQHSRRPVE